MWNKQDPLTHFAFAKRPQKIVVYIPEKRAVALAWIYTDEAWYIELGAYAFSIQHGVEVTPTAMLDDWPPGWLWSAAPADAPASANEAT